MKKVLALLFSVTVMVMMGMQAQTCFAAGTDGNVELTRGGGHGGGGGHSSGGHGGSGHGGSSHGPLHDFFFGKDKDQSTNNDHGKEITPYGSSRGGSSGSESSGSSTSGNDSCSALVYDTKAFNACRNRRTGRQVVFGIGGIGIIAAIVAYIKVKKWRKYLQAGFWVLLIGFIFLVL